MESPDEDTLYIGPEEPTVRRFRFSIGSLMILVVVGALLAWLARQVDRVEDLYQYWPATLLVVPISGIIWSIVWIYKNPPDRQTLPTFVLIGSLLLLCLGPYIFMIAFFRI